MANLNNLPRASTYPTRKLMEAAEQSRIGGKFSVASAQPEVLNMSHFRSLDHDSTSSGTVAVSHGGP